MRFIKVENQSEGLQYLLNGLNEALGSYEKIAWIVSGGSNIEISSNAVKKLPKDKLKKITIFLGDERYGAPGHKDSNYAQFQNIGIDLNNFGGAPVLKDKELSLLQTADSYDRYVREIFSSSEVIIGQFGMGPDGHTAGILPKSTAAREFDKFVIGYEGHDFKRVTLTFEALKMIDQAYVFAFGENKKPALQLLHDKTIALEDQPAQIFRQFIEESFIISNEIGAKT